MDSSCNAFGLQSIRVAVDLACNGLEFWRIDFEKTDQLINGHCI